MNTTKGQTETPCAVAVGAPGSGVARLKARLAANAGVPFEAKFDHLLYVCRDAIAAAEQQEARAEQYWRALTTYRKMSGPRAHRRGCDCGGIEPATGLSCGQFEQLMNGAAEDAFTFLLRRLEAELGRRGAAPDGLLREARDTIQRVVDEEEQKLYRPVKDADPTHEYRCVGCSRAAWEIHKKGCVALAYIESFYAVLTRLDAALSALLDAPPEKNLGSS